ncbi:MAG: diguanylate cyclase [Planctomycetaceae bacterium]|nr:diguanylate cyclase [Planctomycetaceae bacterium]
MPRLSSIHRIVIGLVGLSVSVLLVAGLLGLIPNPVPQQQQSRKSYAESTAVSFMALASRMSTEEVQATLDQIRFRNSDICSIGIRQTDNSLLLDSGPHTDLWVAQQETAGVTQTAVPISANGSRWGRLEICWKPVSGLAVMGTPLRPELGLAAFVGVLSFVAFSFYLGKVLKHISPSRVVPSRVRDALNALAEGLLVLDSRQSIVLANDSFASATGQGQESLIGRKPDVFGFQMADGQGNHMLPWEHTASSAEPVKGVLLTSGEGEQQKTWSVSTSPVKDARNRARGVVASFEDVTQLQKKQQQLKDALTSLKGSTDEIKKQNRELEWLATRDTLTGCLNRRSFFRDYEKHWDDATSRGTPMSGMMVDIDFFKAINDNHGHGMGDEVLRVVSRTVMETVRETDLVCRYGGEEFTVLFPGTSIDKAEVLAEKCRLAVQALEFPKLKVTASLGVSALCQQPDSPQELLDQADKCLYVAKRHGRNQVVRYDKAQQQIAELSESTAPTREEEQKNKKASAIPFHAVAALTTALSHRDQETAIHSRRVADLCVTTAEGLLSLRECYVLEIAALLHDIGKIGIPDTILRKPGPLTVEELDVVHQYNRLGVDMVRGSFGASVLTEIVENHVVHYDLTNAARGSGRGHRPSVAARILNIANAYDTMVSDLSYRRKMSRSEAFAELRSCAGTQFDPELVERFIGAVKSRHYGHEGSRDVVTRESALSIGLLLEKLIAALDDQDREQLVDITESLQITATTHGLLDIAKEAKQLNDTLQDEHDEIEVMQMAGELMDMCRSTQFNLLQKVDQVPELA